MNRLAVFALAAALCGASAIHAEAASIRVTTWNLKWFPNGGPEEKGAGEQTATITRAADVLRKIDPDIVLLQEVKDYDACARLAEAIKPGAYHVAICSAFWERGEIGKQQVAILAKEHAQAAWSESWKSTGAVDPPRGFAFAWFKIRDADVGVYSLHLKSNLIKGGNREAEAAKNIRKREVSIEQLLVHMREVIATAMPMVKAIVVGGDFNTNIDQPMFAAEKTLRNLAAAGFKDSMEGLQFAARITHPGSHGYPDATFDYLFSRGAKPGKPVITPVTISDHFPVTAEFTIEGGQSSGAERLPNNAPVTATAAATATPPATVSLTRDTSVKIPYGATTLRAGVGLEVLSPPVGGQLRVRYLGQIFTVPAANTDYPASAPSASPAAPQAPQEVAQQPADVATPPPTQTPVTPGVAAPARVEDDLRNIRNCTVEQILAEEAKLVGKVVSLNFRFRGSRVDQKDDGFAGQIIEVVELPPKPGSKKKGTKKLTIAARLPREAADWFNRVPVKTTDGKDGRLTHVFGRVATDAKGKLFLEMLGNEKRTEGSGSRIMWTGQ